MKSINSKNCVQLTPEYLYFRKRMCFGTDLTYFFIRSTELRHVFPTFNLLLFNSVKVFTASKQNGN